MRQFQLVRGERKLTIPCYTEGYIVSLLGTLGGAASNLFLPGSGGVTSGLLDGLADYFTGPTVPVSNTGEQKQPSRSSGPSAAPVIKALAQHASKMGKTPH